MLIAEAELDSDTILARSPIAASARMFVAYYRVSTVTGADSRARWLR